MLSPRCAAASESTVVTTRSWVSGNDSPPGNRNPSASRAPPATGSPGQRLERLALPFAHLDSRAARCWRGRGARGPAIGAAVSRVRSMGEAYTALGAGERAAIRPAARSPGPGPRRKGAGRAPARA